MGFTSYALHSTGFTRFTELQDSRDHRVCGNNDRLTMSGVGAITLPLLGVHACASGKAGDFGPKILDFRFGIGPHRPPAC